MKTLMKTCLAALMLCTSVLAWGQSSKIYTKKARMADFTARTTKVVVSGNSLLDLAFKDEVSSGWNVSPFEYCTVQQYLELQNDNSYYFLRLIRENGVAFLSLSKGGIQKDPDNRKRPFEVVRIAIAADGATSGREFAFLGAFIAIVQRFAEDAMRTDMIGYAGLNHYNKVSLEGRKVWFNETAGNEMITRGEADALVGLVIAPHDIGFSTKCYKMLISTDTHELFYYKENKFKGPSDKEFTRKEMDKFAKRNGKLAR